MRSIIYTKHIIHTNTHTNKKPCHCCWKMKWNDAKHTAKFTTCVITRLPFLLLGPVLSQFPSCNSHAVLFFSVVSIEYFFFGCLFEQRCECCRNLNHIAAGENTRFYAAIAEWMCDSRTIVHKQQSFWNYTHLHIYAEHIKSNFQL